jgi:hypothetical protein
VAPPGVLGESDEPPEYIGGTAERGSIRDTAIRSEIPEVSSASVNRRRNSRCTIG